MSLFHKLAPSAQELLQACLAPSSSRPCPVDLQNDSIWLSQVFDRGLTGVMKELLDSGMPVDGNAVAIPLALIDYSQPKALDMARLLLDRGANPHALYAKGLQCRGESSPMHAASQCAPALRLLMQHGGDIHLRDPHGRSLFDSWINATLYRNRKIATALDALQLLVDSGLSPQTLTMDKQPFLPACWASPGLRKNFDRLFAMGFDPYQRGEGTPMRSRSLVDLARLKQGKGVNGALPGALLSQLEAQQLEASVESAPALRPRGARL